MWLSQGVAVSDKVLAESLTAYGFPSGHVSGAIVFYGLVIGLKCTQLTPTARCAAVTAIASAVGVARMVAMAHLPVDVLGAVPLALMILPACLKLSQRYLTNSKCGRDPVRPSKRVASANLAVGSLLLLVGLRLLKPHQMRWASKDLTLAIGIAISTGLAHLMLLAQRSLGFFPHTGELSMGQRFQRLGLGLVGQLAGYGVLRVARQRSLRFKAPWVSEIAIIPTIYGCLHSWSAWVVPSLIPATSLRRVPTVELLQERSFEEVIVRKQKRIQQLEAQATVLRAELAHSRDASRETTPKTTPDVSPIITNQLKPDRLLIHQDLEL